MSEAEYPAAAAAAARLGISLRTVRRRIADGSLPSTADQRQPAAARRGDMPAVALADVPPL